MVKRNTRRKNSRKLKSKKRGGMVPWGTNYEGELFPSTITRVQNSVFVTTEQKVKKTYDNYFQNDAPFIENYYFPSIRTFLNDLLQPFNTKLSILGDYKRNGGTDVSKAVDAFGAAIVSIDTSFFKNFELEIDAYTTQILTNPWAGKAAGGITTTLNSIVAPAPKAVDTAKILEQILALPALTVPPPTTDSLFTESGELHILQWNYETAREEMYQRTVRDVVAEMCYLWRSALLGGSALSDAKKAMQECRAKLLENWNTVKTTMYAQINGIITLPWGGTAAMKLPTKASGTTTKPPGTTTKPPASVKSATVTTPTTSKPTAAQQASIDSAKKVVDDAVAAQIAAQSAVNNAQIALMGAKATGKKVDIDTAKKAVDNAIKNNTAKAQALDRANDKYKLAIAA